MEKVENYCDICGEKETQCFSRFKKIRKFRVKMNVIRWERLDVCDDCYEELQKFVRCKKSNCK